MTRPEYKEADTKDRIAYIGSRNNVLNKSFVTDLWMKVIHRAIDDIVAYRIAKESNKRIREEELESVNDAYGFLFHDEYKIPLDDYMVDIECCECKCYFMAQMSEFASDLTCCYKCNRLQNISISKYKVSEHLIVKEVNLRELLQFWAIEDVDGFRSGVRERIEELMERKKEAIERRKALKEKNKKLKEQKLLETKIKITLDWEHGTYCVRKTEDFDEKFIYVDIDTAQRWFLTQDLYNTLQEELYNLYNKSSNKK